MSCGSDAAGFAICYYLLLCVTPFHAVCICRIPNHSSTILKSLLKLLVDATDSSPYITVQGLFSSLKDGMMDSVNTWLLQNNSKGMVFSCL